MQLAGLMAVAARNAARNRQTSGSGYGTNFYTKTSRKSVVDSIDPSSVSTPPAADPNDPYGPSPGTSVGNGVVRLPGGGTTMPPTPPNTPPTMPGAGTFPADPSFYEPPEPGNRSAGGYGFGPFSNYASGVWNPFMPVGSQNMYGGTYGGMSYGPNEGGGFGWHTVFSPGGGGGGSAGGSSGAGGGAFAGGGIFGTSGGSPVQKFRMHG